MVLGGTKLVGSSDLSVVKEDHDAIMEFATANFPWLDLTVSVM